MSEYRDSFLPLLLVLLPAAFAVLTLVLPKRLRGAREAALVIGAAGNMALGILLHTQKLAFERAWAGWGMDFSLKLNLMNGTFLCVASVLFFLIAVYTAGYAGQKPQSGLTYAGMLFLMATVNGALLSDTLVAMLFFWQAMWAPLFLMIMAGGKYAYRTSLKAIAIAGAADLCIMLATGFFAHEAGSMAMGGAGVPLHHAFGVLAFVLFAAGAMAKAGALPFGRWIPAAAKDASAPTMAAMPGTANMVLGFYLMTRISSDLFALEDGSWLALLLPAAGAVTLVIAGAKALVQKDLKEGISYVTIAMAGALMLGIGRETNVFLLLAGAAAVAGMYLGAGAVESRAGTTELDRLGGLKKAMPLTFAGFMASTVSAALLLPLGAITRLFMPSGGPGGIGILLAAASVPGALMAVAAAIRLCHAVFYGKAPRAAIKGKEAPFLMTLPLMANGAALLTLLTLAATAGGSVLPMVGAAGAAALFALWYLSWIKDAQPLSRADLARLPVIGGLLSSAGRDRRDVYSLAARTVRWYADVSLRINDGVSRFYDVTVPNFVGLLSSLVKKAHNGSPSRYVVFVVLGGVITVVIFLLS